MFARLALCSAVAQVIANGLALLGVSAPETM
jgi:arginyl-tRNA synthetase